MSGLADLSTINRAVGVLLARDHQPDDAHETLQRQAAASGFEPHAWVIRLLRKLTVLGAGLAGRKPRP